MRKRIIRKGNLVCVCKAQSLVKVLLSVVMLCVVFSCSSLKTPFHEDELVERSWACYCVRYNVNQYYPTEEQYDKFLDCWSGSAEEEELVPELYQ